MQAATGAQLFAQSGDSLAAFNAILPLSVGGARAAFDSLSGEAHASFRLAAAEATDLFQTTVARRSGALFGGDAGIASQIREGANLWGAVLAEAGEVEADGKAAELQHQFSGMAFGADGGADALGGILTGGVAAGFLEGRASVDARMSAAEIETWHLGAYGAFDTGPIHVSGALSYGGADIDSTRLLAWTGLARSATAERQAGSLAGTLQAAYRLPSGPMGFSLAPVVVLEYQSGSADAAAEVSANALNLSIAEKGYDRLEAGFGFLASRAFNSLTAEARVVYRDRLEGQVPLQGLALSGAPAALYAVAGPDSGSDRVVLGLGLSGALTSAVSISANYQGSVSSDAESHQARIMLDWAF